MRLCQAQDSKAFSASNNGGSYHYQKNQVKNHSRMESPDKSKSSASQNYKPSAQNNNYPRRNDNNHWRAHDDDHGKYGDERHNRGNYGKNHGEDGIWDVDFS